MKLNEPGRQKLEGQNSWQQTKHERLCSDLLRAFNLKKKTFNSSGFATAGFKISASGAPLRGDALE